MTCSLGFPDSPSAPSAPNPWPRTGFFPCTRQALLIATKAGFGARDRQETNLRQIFIHPRGEERRGSRESSGSLFRFWGQRAWVQALARPLETSYSQT